MDSLKHDSIPVYLTIKLCRRRYILSLILRYTGKVHKWKNCSEKSLSSYVIVHYWNKLDTSVLIHHVESSKKKLKGTKPKLFFILLFFMSVKLSTLCSRKVKRQEMKLLWRKHNISWSNLVYFQFSNLGKILLVLLII